MDHSNEQRAKPAMKSQRTTNKESENAPITSQFYNENADASAFRSEQTEGSQLKTDCSVLCSAKSVRRL